MKIQTLKCNRWWKYFDSSSFITKHLDFATQYISPRDDHRNSTIYQSILTTKSSKFNYRNHSNLEIHEDRPTFWDKYWDLDDHFTSNCSAPKINESVSWSEGVSQWFHMYETANQAYHVLFLILYPGWQKILLLEASPSWKKIIIKWKCLLLVL